MSRCDSSLHKPTDVLVVFKSVSGDASVNSRAFCGAFSWSAVLSTEVGIFRHCVSAFKVNMCDLVCVYEIWHMRHRVSLRLMFCNKRFRCCRSRVRHDNRRVTAHAAPSQTCVGAAAGGMPMFLRRFRRLAAVRAGPRCCSVLGAGPHDSFGSSLVGPNPWPISDITYT